MVCVTARRSQALLASDPVLAQQVTGTPGSPEATTTIEGNLRHVGCDPARLILGKPDGGGDHRSAIGRNAARGCHRYCDSLFSPPLLLRGRRLLGRLHQVHDMAAAARGTHHRPSYVSTARWSRGSTRRGDRVKSSLTADRNF
jgi:hypothetical protein